MDNDTRTRYEQLKKNIKLYGKAAVAFSGGLSSAFLLRTALSVVGLDNVLAITAISKSIPEDERLRSQALIKEWGIKQVFIETDFWREASQHNSNRCKACREDLYKKITEAALERGFDLVLDGSTLDDLKCSWDVNGTCTMLVKPLAQAGLTKQHLREIAKSESWSLYDLPEESCLMSRFDHDRNITAIDLERVDRAETILRNLGFSHIRVCDHGDVARLEIDPDEWERFNDQKLRDMVQIGLNKLGYVHTALDIKTNRSVHISETGNVGNGVKKISKHPQ